MEKVICESILLTCIPSPLDRREREESVQPGPSKQTPKGARCRDHLETKVEATGEDQRSTLLTAVCSGTVACNCIVCCQKINLSPRNFGRLIRACREGANEPKSSSKFLCNLSDFILDEDTIRLLSKGLTFIPKREWKGKKLSNEKLMILFAKCD